MAQEQMKGAPRAPETMGEPAFAPEEAVPGIFARWKMPIMIGAFLAAGLGTWYVTKLLEAPEEKAPQAVTKAASLITATDEYVRQAPPVPTPPRRPRVREEPKPDPAPVEKAPETRTVYVKEAAPEPEKKEEKPQPQGPTLSERRLAAPMMGSVDTPKKSASRREEAAGEEPVGSFDKLFQSSKLAAGSAARVKNRSLVLPKGTFINCIMETAVDTTVPGMTSCRIPENVFSMDGRTLLVEAGSRAFGEYRGAVAQGVDRIFMLWTQIETPHGVIVDLGSPATDSLGRAGVTGEVDHHWWRRFGNALLFSIIDDAFQFAMEKASDSENSINNYSSTDSGMSSFLSQVMRETGQIPPTIRMNQGTRVGIFVARNIDMSSVYRLEADDGVEERP